MEKAILSKAIFHYGIVSQVNKAIEEMAELTKELCKGNEQGILEEMADVEIMLGQLKLIFGDPVDVKKMKLERLERRIEADE